MSSTRGSGTGDDQRDEKGLGEPGEDKVIRLPRDWLGPREELVPFGPSADRDSHEFLDPSSGEGTAPVDDASARRPLEEVPPGPVSPDDFWGERSAALQGPLDEADREAAVDHESGPSLRRRRIPVLAAAAATLVAVAILSVSLLGQSSPWRSRVSARIGHGGGVDSGGGRGTLWPLPAHTPLALHRAGRSDHRRSKPKKPTPQGRGTSVVVNYVRQSSPPQQRDGAGYGSGGTPSSGANPGPVTGGAPTNPSGASGASPTSPANPAGANGSSRHKAPAFGAGGALGPGHSRTG
jgi:hypothetical protein